MRRAQEHPLHSSHKSLRWEILKPHSCVQSCTLHTPYRKQVQADMNGPCTAGICRTAAKGCKGMHGAITSTGRAWIYSHS